MITDREFIVGIVILLIILIIYLPKKRGYSHDPKWEAIKKQLLHIHYINLQEYRAKSRLYTTYDHNDKVMIEQLFKKFKHYILSDTCYQVWLMSKDSMFPKYLGDELNRMADEIRYDYIKNGFSDIK